MQFHQRVARAEAQAEVSMHVMEHLATGVIFLDHRGHLIFLNRLAQTILDRNDGLFASRNGLAASTTEQTTDLRCMIADAALTTRGEGLSSGGTIGLRRPSGKRNLFLVVTPISNKTLSLDYCRPAVIVFVSDPENMVRTDAKRFSAAFGLTGSESKLAVRLAQGETLVQAAEALGVSHETARTHVKRIFDKTGARHQGDLVRVLLASITPDGL